MRNYAYKMNVSLFIFFLLLLYNGMARVTTLDHPGPKLQILLVKVFSLTQKTNEILPATVQKSNFVSSRKEPHVPSDLTLYWNEYLMFPQTWNFIKISNYTFKWTRYYNGDIQSKSYSGWFRHIHAYSSIFRNYSGTFRTVCKPGIFRTLAYGKSETYSEL